MKRYVCRDCGYVASSLNDARKHSKSPEWGIDGFTGLAIRHVLELTEVAE